MLHPARRSRSPRKLVRSATPSRRPRPRRCASDPRFCRHLAANLLNHLTGSHCLQTTAKKAPAKKKTAAKKPRIKRQSKLGGDGGFFYKRTKKEEASAVDFTDPSLVSVDIETLEIPLHGAEEIPEDAPPPPSKPNISSAADDNKLESSLATATAVAEALDTNNNMAIDPDATTQHEAPPSQLPASKMAASTQAVPAEAVPAVVQASA